MEENSFSKDIAGASLNMVDFSVFLTSLSSTVKAINHCILTDKKKSKIKGQSRKEMKVLPSLP